MKRSTGLGLTVAAWLTTSWLTAGLHAQVASAPKPAQSVERFEGVATTNDGKLVYRERHEVRYVGQLPLQSLTQYFDTRGAKIAELRTDYRGDPYAPRYVFSGADGRTRESTEWVAGGLRFQNLRESKVVARSAAGKDRIVLGQGLHQLVRANIAALAAGKKLVVSFGIPSRLDFYEFRIQRAAGPRAGVIKLKIEINDWFLRMFAPSLEVDYDITTRQLLAYRGISNLPGPGGENQHVVIRYAYLQRSAPAAVAQPALATVQATGEHKP